MSGGIAYVYDPDGDFHIRCNKEIVDLEALDEEDMELVRGLMDRHREYTGSTVADRLLNDWPAVGGKFVKVFPRDFKRAILEGVEAAKTDVQAAQGAPVNRKRANGKLTRAKTGMKTRAKRG
jgi:glutamate synthase domain-containing protein 3